MAAEVAEEIFGVHDALVAAVGQGLAALLQLPQADGQVEEEQARQQVHQQHDHQELLVPMVGHAEEVKEQQGRHSQGRLPHQGDAAQHVDQPAQGAAEQTQSPGDDGALEHRAGLALGGEGGEEQVEEQNADGDSQGADVAHALIQEGKPEDESRQPQIRRDPVKPGEMDALMALPVSGGGQGEAEAEEPRRHQQHLQHDEGVAGADEVGQEQLLIAQVYPLRVQGGRDRDALTAVSIAVGHLPEGGGGEGIVTEQDGVAAADLQSAGTVLEIPGEHGGKFLGGRDGKGGPGVLQIDVGVAQLLVAETVVHLAIELRSAVQVDVVFHQVEDARAAGHGQHREHDHKAEGRDLGPGLVKPFLHCFSPSIL